MSENAAAGAVQSKQEASEGGIGWQAAKFPVSTITCKRCGHTWIPRTVDPRQCPACKTVRFDTPKDPADGRSKRSHSA